MKIRNFIIVDDNQFDIEIFKMIIKIIVEESNVESFDTPEKGLEYILNYGDNDRKDEQILVFLDLNMPSMSGWDFLNTFDKFKDEIKNNFKIFILSSSIDLRDIQRALDNKYVESYVTKPLDISTLSKTILNVEKSSSNFADNYLSNNQQFVFKAI